MPFLCSLFSLPVCLLCFFASLAFLPALLPLSVRCPPACLVCQALPALPSSVLCIPCLPCLLCVSTFLSALPDYVPAFFAYLTTIKLCGHKKVFLIKYFSVSIP